MHVANYSMFLGVDLERIVVAGGELLLYEPEGKSTEITMIGVNTGNAATYEIFAAYEPSIAWNEHDMPVEGGYNFRTEIHGIYGSVYFFNHETAKKSCS